MAVTATPIFAQALRAGLVSISTANTNRDGTGTIATVITADLGVAGQLAPGDLVTFVVCSMDEALTALIALERVLAAIEARA